MFLNIITKLKVKTFLFISYLSVLLFPIFIFTYSYIENYQILKNEINNSNIILLEQIKDSIDSYISDFNKICLNLQVNKSVQLISYDEGTLDLRDHYTLYELKQALASYKVANIAISDILIYFKKTNVVVNTRTTYNTGLLPFIDNEPLYNEEWDNIYESLEGYADYKLLGRPSYSTSLLVSPLNMYDKNNILSIAAITFNDNYIINQIQNNLHNKANICIINDENQIVLTTDNNLTDTLDFSTVNEVLTPTLTTNQNNEKYIITLVNSDVSNWKYAYILPNDVYYYKLYHVIKMMLLSFLVCSVLGIFLVFIYAKLNYHPVERILSYIKDSDEKVEANNEYDTIISVLQKKQSETRYMQNILRNDFITKIINGSVKLSLVRPDTLAKLNLQFTTDRFIVVIIRIFDPGIFKETDYIDSLELSSSPLKFSICNVFSELVSGDFNSYSCEINDDIVFILNCKNNNSGHKKESIIKDLLNQTITLFKEKFNAILWAGFSNVIYGLDKVSHGYTQAGTACEYLEIFENKNVCYYGDIENSEVSNDLVSIENDYLVNVVISGRKDELIKCLDTIFEKLFSENRSLFEVKYLIYYFYRTTILIKNKLVQKYGSNYPHCIDNIQNIFFNPSLKRVYELIYSVYSSVCDFVNKNEYKEKTNICKKICNYIESNYIDSNLNLNIIADYFGYTPAYLSKMFREDIGISINDYIIKVRINKAKELITKTNSKISDVAEMVGFINSNSFIRIFKKTEGVTPGKFKTLFGN